MQEFLRVLGDKPNQSSKQRDDVKVSAADLLNFEPESPITEAGLRMNINVGIHYLGAWLGGNGCVPIHNLMEDAATAEISRSQVWQWIRSSQGRARRRPQGHRGDGARAGSGRAGEDQGQRRRRAVRPRGQIFTRMSTQDAFEEFLTLPLYEEI